MRMNSSFPNQTIVMKTTLPARSPWQRVMKRFVLGGLLSLTAVTARADTEQDLIASLQSAASVPEKCAACQKLRVVGTAKAVPALAALLSEERTGHAARYALEGMPAPEAGAALREALGKNAGLTKAGLIDSLGCRRDPESLPLLVPLLSDADPTIAAATAAALGKMGGKVAIAGLTGVRDQAPPTVQAAVLEGLLQCAERLFSDGNSAGAAAIYHDLFVTKFPVQIRTAAWRGLAMSDAGQRADLVVKALAGTDLAAQVAALKLVRELADPQVIKACLGQWASLPAESQLAVLDAHVKLGAVSLATIRTASESPHLAVRVAAWQALADLSEPSFVPALAKAAARGEPAEREAARGSLARLRGPGSREALLACLDQAEVPEKAELLRVLGDRGDTAAANVLLQHAGSDSEPVRLAALASLQRLAGADTLAPLLELAAKAKSDAALGPVLKALYAVCQASPDQEATARRVVETIGKFPVAERRRVLPLLAEFGTSDALAAAQTAARDNDPELAKDAIRVLAQWPNAAPAPFLLELAGTSADATMRALALRGCIGVAGKEPDLSKRLAMLRQASAAAKNADEKKQVVAGLFGITRVLTKEDIVQLDLGYSNGNGYYTDPYKDPDKRPRDRNSTTVLARWNHHFNETDGTARLSYRYYTDTFGIRAHTFGAEYVQPLPHGWTLTPLIRFYSQTAADFYFAVADEKSTSTGAPLPPVDAPWYTEDHRLSAFGAVTAGLKVSKQLNSDWLVDAKFERYEQRDEWCLSGKGDPGLATFKARSIQVGVSRQF